MECLRSLWRLQAGSSKSEKNDDRLCKAANRRGDFPNQSFDFLGFQLRRESIGEGGAALRAFLPAASPKAFDGPFAERSSALALHQVAATSPCACRHVQPVHSRLVNYYNSHFYKTQLRPTLKRIYLYVIRCGAQFKRCVGRPGGARLV